MQLPTFKNSDGQNSTSVTFAWVAFIFCMCAVTLGLFEEIKIGDNLLKFRMIDASVILALLGPCFGLYGFRRRNNSNNSQPKSDELKK